MNIHNWRFRPKLVSSTLVLCLLALLCSLGSWQWGRASDKQALHDQSVDGLNDVVLTVDERTQIEKFPQRLAKLTGTYDTTHQFLLDNRTHNGTAGYHVLTPATFRTSGVAVLVNRGWLPVGPSRTKLPDLTVPIELLTIAGTIAPPPRVFLLGGSGHELVGWPRVVQSVDWALMETALGASLLRGQILLAVDEPNGYERAWTPYYGISPERHQAYAVQWYALAVTLLVLYLVVSVKRPGLR